MDGPVDVVLLTKNSQRKLRECVESIYQNVPIAKLIVVDGYSTDDTLRIIEDFDQKFGNVKVIFDKGNRATARQKGIEAVKTEWFMFVDSDVVLCHDWFKKAKKYVTDDVGAVWGIEVWSTLKNPKTLRLFLLTTHKIFEVRGGTHDTLIRTDLVRDIKIPSYLHVFEDTYIKEWIEQKGCRVVACYSPFCIHFRPTSIWTFRGSLGLVAESIKIGSPLLISRLLLAYGFYTVYSFYQLLGR
ncbi:MAG: glycosyltransferase family A protein [Betaproteobacteria bacterium]